jgi:Plasmid stability protein
MSSMATLTIRNLPEELIERLKVVAQNNGHSMEQEVRALLQSRYASRSEILDRAHARWESLPRTTAREVKRWREQGRAR